MKPGKGHRAAVFFSMTALFLILSFAFLHMPAAGDLDNPSNNINTRRYISGSTRDTGAPNVVNAIIADYRSFDTLGEAVVLFVSITAVATVLVTVGTRSRK